ncbi:MULTISPECIES: cytidine deaminase [Streptomyces]|uniref:cytidine deaminase n=1 Tax=Streptomyces TaxID=1883 RepID=UPI000B5C2136|nr:MULTISPECIES: cytidine deaminase [unclassified Streptomyces]MBK3546900.1 cytidine deaminase [Streptomyces sp. MBT60]MCA1272908.1 cytidine deaminase [Streptomyces sp. 7G]
MTPPPAPAFGEADWDALREAARDAMSRAYAPYSGFPVGVAARVDDGRTITGCNVENASYGLSLCAECGLVSTLHATGGGRLTHFTCVDGTGAILVPCGRCRQLLYEFGGPELLLETPDGIRTLDEMLPQSFGPQHLG